ncbi:MAG: hypothetical protein ACQEWD_08830 [Bacteroidota bacterium]
MTNLKRFFLLFVLLGNFLAAAQNEEKIKVLNYTTSHLTNTSDAYSSYFDVFLKHNPQFELIDAAEYTDF